MAKLEFDETIIRWILEEVNGLEYGVVQINVHDGRIVQIERTERKRFDVRQSCAPEQAKYRIDLGNATPNPDVDRFAGDLPPHGGCADIGKSFLSYRCQEEMSDFILS